MQGLIFRENEKLKIDDVERLLKFNGKFEKFMYWNYDKNPSENDSFRKAFNYLKLAEDVSTFNNTFAY
jgi:ribonuclease H2 subunit C